MQNRQATNFHGETRVNVFPYDRVYIHAFSQRRPDGPLFRPLFYKRIGCTRVVSAACNWF